MCYEPIQRLIRRYRLHQSYPVDLAPLSERYDIRYHPFTPSLMGFALRSGAAALIGVNSSLHLYTQRMILAHEIAHVVLGHPNRYCIRRTDQWWFAKNEFKAQFAAGLILCPATSLVDRCIGHSYDGAQLADLSEAFQVPPELIMLQLATLHHIPQYCA
jgi:Zn-dependent peptidase ImmA (M78 family)